MGFETAPPPRLEINRSVRMLLCRDPISAIHWIPSCAVAYLEPHLHHSAETGTREAYNRDPRGIANAQKNNLQSTGNR